MAHCNDKSPDATEGHIATPLLAGAVEYLALPDLGITRIRARIDTGAATSSLHVDNIVEYRVKGKRWVSFDIHPRIHRVKRTIHAKARVVSKRRVKSSSADTERRIVISTTLAISGHSWPVQLTLTDRSAMTYPMLLGRQAMAGRIYVDPGSEYLLTTGN